jgi:hypothetical protein
MMRLLVPCLPEVSVGAPSVSHTLRFPMNPLLTLFRVEFVLRTGRARWGCCELEGWQGASCVWQREAHSRPRCSLATARRQRAVSRAGIQGTSGRAAAGADRGVYICTCHCVPSACVSSVCSSLT